MGESVVTHSTSTTNAAASPPSSSVGLRRPPNVVGTNSKSPSTRASTAGVGHVASRVRYILFLSIAVTMVGILRHVQTASTLFGVSGQYDHIPQHFFALFEENDEEGDGPESSTQTTKSSLQARDTSQQQQTRKASQTSPTGTTRDGSQQRRAKKPSPVSPRVTNMSSSSSSSLSSSSRQSAASSSSGGCFEHNSRRWLSSRRYKNIGVSDDPLLTVGLVRQLIEEIPNVLASPGNAQPLLDRSICVHGSRFRNDSEVEESNLDVDVTGISRTLRIWAARLTYLAFHYHQHRLAIPEYTARYDMSTTVTIVSSNAQQEKNHAVSTKCQSRLDKYKVGLLDYECRRKNDNDGSYEDARFLVVGLSGSGIGANIRTAANIAMMLGLVMDRIVLIVNNQKDVGGSNLAPWYLASCEDRMDYQCFFMPPSPCVPAMGDLTNSYTLPRSEFRQILEAKSTQKINATLDSLHKYRVVRFNSRNIPFTNFAPLAAQRLVQYARLLIKKIPGGPENQRRRRLLMDATNLITKKSPARPVYNYALANDRMQHALALYFLRPRPSNLQRMHSIVQEQMLSNSFFVLNNENMDKNEETLNNNHAIGLPVRASDKCQSESECLSFDEHMEAVSILWSKYQYHKNASLPLAYKILPESNVDSAGNEPVVVFTSEAQAMLDAQDRFVKSRDQQKRLPFRFRFLMNSKDRAVNGGSFKHIKRFNGRAGVDADDLMMASLSSVQMQLYPRYTIGNCCSNFHDLINDLLMEGCGATPQHTFVCLQEFADPELRICCGWHKKCVADRAEQLAEVAVKLAALAKQEEQEQRKQQRM